jgi:hypothetical protein
MNDHSGKNLSDVPYDEIRVGMELISTKGTPGKISKKIDKKIQHDDNWLLVHWNNGNMSCDEHYNFSKVKVK